MERVFAQGIPLSDVAPGTAIDTFGEFVNIIVRNAFMIAGILAFVILVFGGFSVIMGAGGGDSKRLEQGQKAIGGAVAGLLLVIASFWIVQMLEKITGVNLLKLP